MHVWVDREGCISCGQCEETCPQVFAIMEDGLADVKQQPDEDLEDLAQAAADGCPGRKCSRPLNSRNATDR